ncbi:MAG: GlsB/YeaQ/YmgE family stress response membrane protein [Acidimicrobiales bacterium]
MILFIISLIIGGLIIGALGRLAVPGPNPMTIGTTILVGIGGSFLGGLVGYLLLGRPGGWILAVLCAALIVWLMQRSQARRAY